MKGILFEEDPGPVHDNCLCERERVVSGHAADGHTTIIVPPGVDIEANIREAKQKTRAFLQQAMNMVSQLEIPARLLVQPFLLRELKEMATDAFAFGLKCGWLYENFKPGARYDFKKHDETGHYHPEYEAFGNYHYGLYSSAMGMDLTVIEAGAGFAQFLAGTWVKENWRTWFDDPDDNKMVRKGYSYPID
ncbi:MAG: polymorphic toxin type 44 domain-containing protein [Desulfovibrionaceae bacterium]